MRLDKLLANMGYGSRKEVKQLVKKGAVTIDGKTAKHASIHADPKHQEIIVLGEALIYEEYVYFMMNKPKGILSATKDNFQKTVIDLLSMRDRSRSPFPVGRLDKNTEGLLLLTNDGTFAHRITSPKKEVPKVYEARLNLPISEEDILAFEKGVVLDDGYQTKPASLHPLDSNNKIVSVTITEGKYHQVKRMFRARGKKVVALKRTHMGPLELDPALPKGGYRKLRKEEIALFFRHKQKKD